MENLPVSLRKTLRDGREAAIIRQNQSWTVRIGDTVHATGARVVKLAKPIGDLTHTLTSAAAAPVGITTKEAADLKGAAAYLDARSPSPWQPGEVRFHNERGVWKVQAAEGDLQAGEVTVTRKSGSTQTVTVTKVYEPFTEGGRRMVLADIAQSEPTSCANCGHDDAPHRRRDSSNIPGMVCGKCSRLAFYNRSYA